MVILVILIICIRLKPAASLIDSFFSRFNIAFIPVKDHRRFRHHQSHRLRQYLYHGWTKFWDVRVPVQADRYRTNQFHF